MNSGDHYFKVVLSPCLSRDSTKYVDTIFKNVCLSNVVTDPKMFLNSWKCVGINKKKYLSGIFTRKRFRLQLKV